MNGRKAKELRRAAEAATVGRPSRMYQSVHVAVTNRARVAQGFLTAIQTKLAPDCTRAVYQTRKRDYKSRLSV